MECRAATEYINMYVDNMLDDAETEELLEHIRFCKNCKKELNDIKLLKNALSKLEELEPPAGLAKSAIKKARKHRAPIFAYATAGVAAVIALVAIFSTGILNNDGDLARQKMSYYGESSDSAAEEMENYAAPEAAAPMATEAPKGVPNECTTLQSAAGGVDERGLSGMADDSSGYSVTVFPESSESTRQKIQSFVEKYDIDIEQTDNVITFIIPEEHITELESIISDAGIALKDKLTGGYSIEFIFE